MSQIVKLRVGSVLSLSNMIKVCVRVTSLSRRVIGQEWNHGCEVGLVVDGQLPSEVM